MRDQLALERTKLANERTFLAYVRTSLSLIAAAAVLLQFFAAGFVSEASAWLLAIVGVLVLGIGIYRFLAVRAALGKRMIMDEPT